MAAKNAIQSNTTESFRLLKTYQPEGIEELGLLVKKHLPLVRGHIHIQAASPNTKSPFVCQKVNNTTTLDIPQENPDLSSSDKSTGLDVYTDPEGELHLVFGTTKLMTAIGLEVAAPELESARYASFRLFVACSKPSK